MAILRASAGEGGWKRVVGGSSVFALSARAVDKEIVGSDSVGELTRCEGEFRKACCCAAAAASREAVAVRVSLFVLGEVEKNWANLLARAADGFRVIAGFSLKNWDDWGAGVGELLPKGLSHLRGIVGLIF